MNIREKLSSIRMTSSDRKLFGLIDFANPKLEHIAMCSHLLEKYGMHDDSDQMMKKAMSLIKIAADNEARMDASQIKEQGQQMGTSNPDNLKGLYYTIRWQPLEQITRNINPETIIEDLVKGGNQNSQQILGSISVQVTELLSRAGNVIAKGITNPQQILQILQSPEWSGILYTDSESLTHERAHQAGQKMDRDAFIREVVMPNIPNQVDDSNKQQLAEEWTNNWEQSARNAGYGDDDFEDEMAARAASGEIQKQVQESFNQ